MSRISLKATDYLLKCTNPAEEYESLEFTKEDAIESLEYIKNNSDGLDKDDILFELGNEFLGVGIMFLDESEYNKKVDADCSKSGIVCSEYNQERKMTYVYVNDVFVDNLINEKYDLLADDIIKFSKIKNKA